MPDTKSPDTTSPDTKDDSRGGPKRLVIVGVLCAGLLGAGYFLGGMLSGPATAADAGAAAASDGAEADAEAEEEVGHVIDLEPVNINLADNHYLRVAISLGLAHDAETGEHGEFTTAPASDLLLGAFSGRSIDEIRSIEGRDEVRHHLLDELTEAYDGDVIAVYFTQFVMQ